MTASLEGNLEVVRELLKRGASPNAVAIRGSTALIQACHFGKLQVVEELLKNGASVEQANYKNTTALMRAAQEGHEVKIIYFASFSLICFFRTPLNFLILLIRMWSSYFFSTTLLSTD